MVFVRALESNRYRRLLNSSKPFFVNELAEPTFESKHLLTGGSQQKLNSVEDVTLARTIKTCDSIEIRVEIGYHSSVHVSLESLQDYLVDVH